MLESKAGVLFIAGIGFFALAFLSNALVPALMYRDLPEQTVEQIAQEQRQPAVPVRRPGPAGSRTASRPPTASPPRTRPSARSGSTRRAEEALRLGHKVYVGEACWHCHSQFVRPVSNEDRRFGPVSKTEEYQNELQRPVLFGTRRVGPRPVPRGGPAVERLACRPLLQADHALHRLADARVSLALRRRTRQAQRQGPGPDHLRPVARLVARELSLLRGLPAVARARPGRESGRTRSDESRRSSSAAPPRGPR